MDGAYQPNSDNQSRRRQLFQPHHDERNERRCRQSPLRPSVDQPSLEDRQTSRVYLQKIALGTVDAINNGIVDVSKTIKRTQFYPADSPELASWRQTPAKSSWYKSRPANIHIFAMSSIDGARYFHAFYPNRRMSILNFASATRPGGGFLDGASAQEESIARSSTLYVSLTSEAVRPFYALHDHDEKGGFYSHAMIYSPNIHIFRDDAGGWLVPFQVDVLSCPAVNAGKARKVYYNTPRDELENVIQAHMTERIARILALFERQGARNLVLGSFGTGVFRNDVRAMAQIWRDLLIAPGTRFASSFENVVFAIPHKRTREIFESVCRP